jgi:hypothetical protein
MAGIPDAGYSTITAAGGSVMINPDGSGESLSSKGLTIDIALRDGNNLPIANFPFQDFWLSDNGVVVVDNGATSPLINLCQGGSVADADTDAAGLTTMSGVISGGGWTLGGTSVYVSGTAIAGGDGPDLGIDINSPDNNGDRLVDLIDIGNFASDLLSYRYRSDLVFSGVIDLSDVGRFAANIGKVCP